MKINKGDYIDSRDFSREECDRFCELSAECGFPDGEGNVFFGKNIMFLGVNKHGHTFWHDAVGCFTSNITAQFREFLDKEKGKVFTKNDLKAEQTVIYRDSSERIVFMGKLVKEDKRGNYEFCADIRFFNDDLTHSEFSGMDIMRVTDRDGTVLFEREEDLRELTIEEIAEAFNLPVERVRIKK